MSPQLFHRRTVALVELLRPLAGGGSAECRPASPPCPCPAARAVSNLRPLSCRADGWGRLRPAVAPGRKADPKRSDVVTSESECCGVGRRRGALIWVAAFGRHCGCPPSRGLSLANCELADAAAAVAAESPPGLSWAL